MKALFVLVVAAITVGCAAYLPRVSSPEQVERHIGQSVILIGPQVDPKLPKVHGVHVDGLPEHDGRKVVAEGVLIRIQQEESDPFVSGGRTGVWYNLINPQTGQLAESTPTKQDETDQHQPGRYR